MLEFVMMHGLGNDFIIVDAIKNKVDEFSKLSYRLCRRHYGAGGDGVIFVLESEKADFRMRIFNRDGSEAEMCGNGIRCFAKYVYDNKLTDKKSFDVETLAGIIKPEIVELKDNKAYLVKVNMGKPILERKDIPMEGEPGNVIDEPLKLADKEVRITAVSMGNPHAVIFVDTFSFDIEVLGKEIEEHPSFPKKTNVEFIQVVNENEINMQVWERGAGVTLACGTGASAALVASVLNKKTERKAVVHLLGGDLEIEWAEDGNVYMTGPAKEVYKGEFNI